mmetsp:Transcript_25304/g.37107  ORF Transcript_25304/g.37107 Transcript_25304/m.37107 type:complete len:105 (-) Transcript_25304:74-388(-)
MWHCHVLPLYGVCFLRCCFDSHHCQYHFLVVMVVVVIVVHKVDFIVVEYWLKNQIPPRPNLVSSSSSSSLLIPSLSSSPLQLSSSLHLFPLLSLLLFVSFALLT